MLRSDMRRAAKGGSEFYQHAQRGSLGESFMLRVIRATEGLELKDEAIKLAVGNDHFAPQSGKP